MKAITNICQIDPENPTRMPVHLDYKMTLRLIDQLKACDEIASSRTSNWQTFCHTEKSNGGEKSMLSVFALRVKAQSKKYFTSLIH